MKKYLVLSLMLIMASATSWAYSGGDGSAENPYQIATTNDLIELSKTKADWESNNFILTADIIFPKDETTFDWNGDGVVDFDGEDSLGFSPIGDDTMSYVGSFDGKHFSVVNLFIFRPEQNGIGVFKGINSSIFLNIGIVDCNITGNFYVGSLCGSINSSIINNCYSTGIISGNGKVGGLVGASWDKNKISYCYSYVDVSGVSTIGGLIGLNKSLVSNCSATGKISCSYYPAGGLVGCNSSHAEIKDCFATGSVDGVIAVGGLVGYQEYFAEIHYCYATGDVSGQSQIGGLVGRNEASTINISYALGNVSGYNSIGAFVGENSGTREDISTPTPSIIKNCYARGNVSRNQNNGKRFGGFCGANYYAEIWNCYSTGSVDCGDILSHGFLGAGEETSYTSNFFDAEVSNQKTDSINAATPKTTSEMKTQNTFTDAGWDFETIWAISPDINNGYPHFIDGVSAISEDLAQSDNSIFCYPNPVSRGTILNIDLDNQMNDYNVKLYDSNGLFLIEYKNTNFIQIPNDISAGTYFIVIESEGNIFGFDKIIIE